MSVHVTCCWFGYLITIHPSIHSFIIFCLSKIGSQRRWFMGGFGIWRWRDVSLLTEITFGQITREKHNVSVSMISQDSLWQYCSLYALPFDQLGFRCVKYRIWISSQVYIYWTQQFIYSIFTIMSNKPILSLLLKLCVKMTPVWTRLLFMVDKPVCVHVCTCVCAPLVLYVSV